MCVCNRLSIAISNWPLQYFGNYRGACITLSLGPLFIHFTGVGVESGGGAHCDKLIAQTVCRPWQWYMLAIISFFLYFNVPAHTVRVAPSSIDLFVFDLFKLLS